MANSLTGLYQTIYAALNVVSRELVGMIPAVSKDSRAEQVTLNQAIRSPVVPRLAASDITPSNVSATGADRNVTFVDLEITKQRKVSFHMTGEESKGLMAGGVEMDIDTQSFAEAFRTLGNEIETDLAGLYIEASRAHGTVGTDPFNTADDLTDITQIGKILDDNGAPKSGRTLVMNTTAHALLQGKQPSVFRVNEAGDTAGRRMGTVGRLMNFDLGVTGQLPAVHDASVSISGLMVNNSSGEGIGETAITVDGGGSGEILRAGDIVTFAGDTNKYLTKAMAASATTMNLNGPGLRQAAANNAAITAGADYEPMGVAFSMDAYHLVCRVPAVPKGGDSADDRMYVMDPHSSLVYEIAIYRQYRQVSIEVGICWGVKTVSERHAALLIG